MDTNKDLWSEFAANERDGAAPEEEKPVKKSAATDGSEWVGRFDRRSMPRDVPTDSADGDAGQSADGSA